MQGSRQRNSQLLFIRVGSPELCQQASTAVHPSKPRRSKHSCGCSWQQCSGNRGQQQGTECRSRQQCRHIWPNHITAQYLYDGTISLSAPSVSKASLSIIMPDYKEGAYAVVLQEQVGLADFRLHLKPVQPWDFIPKCAGNISEAGQGLGLQVFPGTKPAMDCGRSMSVRLSRATGKPDTVEAGLPRELALSQLPPSQTTFPANLALTIISIGVRGGQPEQLLLNAATAKLRHKQGRFYVSWKFTPAFAAHTDRRIVRMALTTDKQLTMYLVHGEPAHNHNAAQTARTAAAAAPTSAPAPPTAPPAAPPTAPAPAPPTAPPAAPPTAPPTAPPPAAPPTAPVSSSTSASSAAVADPGTFVPQVWGLAGCQSQQQQQHNDQAQLQQQSIVEYVQHSKVVRFYCAADPELMAKLNTMNLIALGCMTATDRAQQQQQQQQQQIDRGQLLQQYFDAEAVVMMYCAGNSRALAALHSMSSIACMALAQAG